MFARVVTVQTPPDRLDDGVRLLREQVIPAERSMSGFKSAYVLGDRQTGKSLVVTLWESEEALRASEQAMGQTRTQSTQDLSAAVQSVERYEVLVQG